jgi:hypothetical protein
MDGNYILKFGELFTYQFNTKDVYQVIDGVCRGAWLRVEDDHGIRIRGEHL